MVISKENDSCGVVVGFDVDNNDELFVRVVQDENVSSQIVRLRPDRLSFMMNCDDPTVLCHRSLHLYVSEFQNGKFVPSNELAYIFDSNRTDGLLLFQRCLNNVVDTNLYDHSEGSSIGMI